jgi:hypothetical protein
MVAALHANWDVRSTARLPVVVSHLGDVSVAYAGIADGLRYTLEFTELVRSTPAADAPGRIYTSVRAKYLGDVREWPDADVLLIGTTAPKAQILAPPRSLILPMRVHFVVDIEADPALMNSRISKRQRWQFSRDQRIHQWTWRLETEPAAFDLFYDRFYRPTMRRSHGERERIEGRSAAYECLFKTGKLFFLYERGERIGGALCSWDPSTRVLTLRLFGVLDADAKHYESGALRAIYHFLIAWSAENGVGKLDLGGTEPFLSKGTFQWKRRFGSRITLPLNHFGRKRVCLVVRRDSPAVRDLLVANPVLAEGADGVLEAVYFYDEKRDPRLDLSAKAPSGPRARKINLSEFLADGVGGGK